MEIPVTKRGDLLVERKVLFAEKGLVSLLQHFSGTSVRTIVTHNAFVLAQVTVQQGELTFPFHSGIFVPPKRFVIAIPPGFPFPMAFTKAHVRSEGVAGFYPVGVKKPTLFSCMQTIQMNRASISKLIASPKLAEFDPDNSAKPFVIKARKQIHFLLSHPAPVRMAARHAGVAPETLSRSFSNTYGLSPKQYCHKARLFEAVLHLLLGVNILDSSLRSGFEDLSRFYQQFRRRIGTTPGQYARIKKHQEK